MICSNCNNVYENLTHCPLCNTPSVNYNEGINYDEHNDNELKNEIRSFTKKIKVNTEYIYPLVDSYSKKYYNFALEASKKRDITGAIKFAKTSIYFDKNNKDARNLLGLCYLEVGLVGEASYEFFVSCFIDDSEINPANKYIAIVEENVVNSEEYDLSIEYYNRAVSYAKKNSIKSCISELESAIEYNSKFVNAYLLLALCNLMLKDYKNVTKYCNKVLEIDLENPFAIKYLSEIKIDLNKKSEDKSDSIKIKKDIDNSFKYPSYDSGISVKENKKSKFPLIIGIFIGCLVTFILIKGLDTFFNLTDDKLEILQIEYDTLKQNYDIIKEQYDEEVNILKEDFENLKSQNLQLEASVSEESAKTNLNTAVFYYNAGDIYKSAKYLKIAYDEHTNATSTGENVVLSDADIELYNELSSKTFSDSALYYFNLGTENYENQMFVESISDFSNSIFFYENSDNIVQAVDSYYWLGRSYEESGNVEDAVSIYNFILESYPEYSLNSEIKERIENLGA
ncbi:MAG: tetratricopeptide repeat protein [Lachnospirales bacterium]